MQHTVKVIPVIYQTLETRGTGKDSTSPVRKVTRVHDLNGNLLAESDPHSFAIEQIHAVAAQMYDLESANNLVEKLMK